MNYTGGFLWMKKVADQIEDSNRYSVIKSYVHGNTKKILHRLFYKIRDLIRTVIYSPDFAIIDAWGESSIVVWLILRLFRKNTKIFVVFHHYEERIPVCKNIIETFYNFLIESIVSVMLKNSDIILTVSKSSMEDLKSIYDVGKGMDKNMERNEILLTNNVNTNKIAIVGTGIDVDLLNVIIHGKKKIEKKKDIDFLCMGRIEKFFLLEKIWMQIKKHTPNSNLVMVGRASPEVINKLLSIGIDHKGFVSEEEKIDLYSRAKVFIFPSSKEGFGIAVAEALFLGIPVIAWKIPVFEDLYSKNEETKIKLVEYGNWSLFAEEAIKSVDKYDLNNQSNAVISKSNIVFPTWKSVAQNVISVIEYTR
jgi:glycosyltransferase involved in cell wall biosynthesis